MELPLLWKCSLKVPAAGNQASSTTSAKINPTSEESHLYPDVILFFSFCASSTSGCGPILFFMSHSSQRFWFYPCCPACLLQVHCIPRLPTTTPCILLSSSILPTQ